MAYQKIPYPKQDHTCDDGGTDKYLEEDELNPDSANDFGKNIIPAMLEAGEKMYSYSFEGYWKDVGTLSSLWEANMDMLGHDPHFSLQDESWRIFSRTTVSPPQFVGPEAKVQNSMITSGCNIYGTVINSVLSNGVTVEAGAVVRDSVIMANTTVRAGANVEYSIIDSDVTVGNNARVGAPKADGIDVAVIGSGVSVEKDTVIDPGQIISK